MTTLVMPFYKANGIPIMFGFYDPLVLTKLRVSVCLSMVVLYDHLTFMSLSIWMSV